MFSFPGLLHGVKIRHSLPKIRKKGESSMTTGKEKKMDFLHSADKIIILGALMELAQMTYKTFLLSILST